MAYLPGYYPAMDPAQMRYVASLNGVKPPAGNSFSYLELGCGFGGTILPLAAANPACQFVGVDFMSVHAEHISQERDAGGLSNLEVICADFADLPTTIGCFDYITLHGVFSWISPALRKCVLEVIQKHLKPGGIVEVTYNCLPGWASLLPVRSLFRQFAARQEGDSIQRVEFALREIEALHKADIPLFHDCPLASQLVEKLLLSDPHYIAHEYLNEHWVAFEATEVQEMFSGIGLHYAGRLPIHHNHWQLCAKQQFAHQFMGLGNADAELLKDFHANIMFRWDLYTNGSAGSLTQDERIEAISDLCFRVASPANALPHVVQYGAIEAGLNGPPHDKLLDVMGGAGWTLPQLLASDELGEFGPEIIVEAIDTGIALQLFKVDGGHVNSDTKPLEAIPAGGIQVPLVFNQKALSRENLSNEQLCLASTKTRAGHRIGDLHALILQEVISGGTDGVELRVANRLLQADKHLREHQTGRPITDRAELVHAAREICAEFMARVLPELFRQEIVVPVEV